MALFYISLQVQAQIAIDEPVEKEIVATPLDGSFMRFPSIMKEDVAIGMIGEKITFIEVSFFSLKNEDGSSISSDQEDNFKNKTFEIIGYEVENYDFVFCVKNETGTYKWTESTLDQYVLNKFLDFTNERLLDKIFIPLHYENQVETLDGTEITINGREEYKVTRVSYAKFSKY